MADEALLVRWQSLLDELEPARARLLAVSKYAPDAAVAALIAAGQRDFGESRPQSLRDRAERWPECRWHMIGPLQKNKAKYVGRHAAMWHSCDSLELARTVAAHVEGHTLPVLLQVNIADNPRQRGVRPEDAAALAESLATVEGLELRGLMGMAPQHGDVRQAFRRLRSLRDELFGGSVAELCMGMSGDYKTAIEEGATIVRLGSVLFEPDEQE